MFADFWWWFISVVSTDFLQMRKSGYERQFLHLFNSIAGYLSGPGDALLVSSSIAASRFSGVKSKSVSLGF